MIAARRRARLPNRRPVITETLPVGGQAIEASVGFDPATGRPRELFLTGAKDGTDLAGFRERARHDRAAAVVQPSSAISNRLGAKPDNLTDRNWTVETLNHRSFWKSCLSVKKYPPDRACRRSRCLRQSASGWQYIQHSRRDPRLWSRLVVSGTPTGLRLDPMPAPAAWPQTCHVSLFSRKFIAC